MKKKKYCFNIADPFTNILTAMPMKSKIIKSDVYSGFI